MYPGKRFAQRTLSQRREKSINQSRTAATGSRRTRVRQRLHVIHEQRVQVPETRTSFLGDIQAEEEDEHGSSRVFQAGSPAMDTVASTPLLAPGSQQLMDLIQQQQQDELTNFFRTICSTVRKFQPANVIKIKKIMSSAIHDIELRELQPTGEQTLSTSGILREQVQRPPRLLSMLLSIASFDGGQTLIQEEADCSLDDDVFD